MAVTATNIWCADKSGNSPQGPLGKQAFDSPSRVVDAEPNGSITPLYAGEMVLDTTNNTLWKAVSMTNTSWVMLTTPGP